MIRYAILAALVLSAPAMAHDAMPTAAQPEGWRYDAVCCQQATANSGDCQDIPATSVKPIPGGYQITLRPGDHHMVTRLHVFQFSQAETRESPDGRYHACLYPSEDNLHCFYAPPMGF